MSNQPLSADDPRLTAYALGELPRAEAAEIEGLLAASPAAQSVVDETRELAALLRTELQAEPAAPLTAAQRSAIFVAAAASGGTSTEAKDVVSVQAVPARRASRGQLIGRVASLLTIAATVVVAVLLVPREPESQIHLGGQTLPSAHYTRGDLQYFPPGPDFKLGNESGQIRDLTLGAQSYGGAAPESTRYFYAARPQPTGAAEKLQEGVELGFAGGLKGEVSVAPGQSVATARGSLEQIAEVQKIVEKQEAAAGNGRDGTRRQPGARLQLERQAQEQARLLGVDESRSMGGAVATKRLGAGGQSLNRAPETAGKSLGEAGRGVTALGTTGALGSGFSAGDYGGFAGQGPTTRNGGFGRYGQVVGVLPDGVLPDDGDGDGSERARRLALPILSGIARPIAEAKARELRDGKEKALAQDVEKFNQLVAQRRLEEAIDLAQRAKQMDPNNPVVELMVVKSQLARQAAITGPRKADTFTEMLNEVDLFSVDYTNAIRYPDTRKWTELTVRSNNAAPASGGRPLSPAEERVQKNLVREISLGFDNAPLSEVVKYLGEQGGLNIVLDRASLGDAADTPVTINVEGIRLKSALNLLLEPSHLGYVVYDDRVQIESASRLDTEVRFAERQAMVDALDKTLADLDELAKSRQRAFLGLARADELNQQEQKLRLQLDRLRRLSEQAPGAEAYDPIVENQFVAPLAEPLSTFGVDVDTASYSNVRRFLNEGQLPPRDAVRIEELVNYFRYDFQPAPNNYVAADESRPFAVRVEATPAPWRPAHRLVRIGIKGREITGKRPASNLVFLVDVSGSMQSENKLPLVKSGLKLLTEQMTEDDRVAIVTYSDTAMLRLASTNGSNRQPILETIEGLQAAGSTNGAGGIQLAYRTALDSLIDGGVNRVILCTDGDFNVGVTGDDELVKMIEERARTKIFFSVFGFGMGNLKDGKLEKLADKGNGHYAYIDGIREAKKMFVDELNGTLVTIAKDVKVQVEFNPAKVAAYRLIGYENRVMAAQDFANDKKDAGDIGAGHSVTALYEVVPAGEAQQPAAAEGLRYQRFGIAAADNQKDELLAVKLRFKQPEGDVSALIEMPAIDLLVPGAARVAGRSPIPPSRDFEWASAVAAFGMILRDSQFRGQAGFDLVLEMARGAKGDDVTGQRQEFIDLVERAKALRPDLASVAAAAPTSAAPHGNVETEQPLVALPREQAEQRATVNGKYKNLLRIIPAEKDAGTYGGFRDFGRWEGTSYLGRNNLPQGYWVYVYPNWFIWGDAQPGQ